MADNLKYAKITRHKHANSEVFIPSVAWNIHETTPDNTPTDKSNWSDMQILEREIENNDRATREAKRRIRNHVANNYTTHFVTFTYNPKKYPTNEKQFKRMKTVLKELKRKHGKFNYLLVPELHQNGNIHWHGVIDFSNMQNELKEAKNSHTGELLKYNGNQLYNFKYWDSTGFSNISKIKNISKVSNYITKYVSKNIGKTVGINKKKFWSSRAENKPEERYLTFEETQNIQEKLTPSYENERGAFYDLT